MTAAREEEFLALGDIIEQLLPKSINTIITFNEHKSCYQNIEDYLKERRIVYTNNDTEKQKIIDSDTIWELQWYPDTPIGFCTIAAHSLGELLRYINTQEG